MYIMYSKIKNPENHKIVSVYSKKGQQIINNYLQELRNLQGGFNQEGDEGDESYGFNQSLDEGEDFESGSEDFESGSEDFESGSDDLGNDLFGQEVYNDNQVEEQVEEQVEVLEEKKEIMSSETKEQTQKSKKKRELWQLDNPRNEDEDDDYINQWGFSWNDRFKYTSDQDLVTQDRLFLDPNVIRVGESQLEASNKLHGLEQKSEKVFLKIPEGVRPGQAFAFYVNGTKYRSICPPGMYTGDTVMLAL